MGLDSLGASPSTKIHVIIRVAYCTCNACTIVQCTCRPTYYKTFQHPSFRYRLTYIDRYNYVITSIRMRCSLPESVFALNMENYRPRRGFKPLPQFSGIPLAHF